jgi:hypothetical protein
MCSTDEDEDDDNDVFLAREPYAFRLAPWTWDRELPRGSKLCGFSAQSPAFRFGTVPDPGRFRAEM